MKDPDLIQLSSTELRPPAAEMAKEDAKPTAAEKGKGKAVDEKLPNGDGKVDRSKAGPDGKLADGKKGDEPQEGISTMMPSICFC